jgi:N-formylglutamate amidohydrolase
MTPFRLVPGSPASAVIVHVPHSSRVLTADARSSILLDDAALAVELDRMTDAHTSALALAASTRAPVRPWLFVNRYSRLVVDPERFPDEREEMAAVGMGAVYTRTSQGVPLRSTVDSSLVSRYFDPYARATASLVAERLAVLGRAVIVDLHSYPSVPLPYELHRDGPRPAVCLGTDPFHTPAGLVGAATAAFAGFGEVGLDSPFAGCYVPLAYHRRDPRVSAIMVEIRRDTYLREPAGAPTPGFSRLVDALATLLAGASGPEYP